MTGVSIEIRRPDGGRETRTIDGPVVVGREAADIVVGDRAVSRRHLGLEVVDGRLVATDLGSSNGTFANGHRIDGPVTIGPADELRLGETVIVVSSAGAAPASPTVAHEAVATPSTPPADADLAVHRTDAVELRYRPGSHAERVVGSYASIAAKARRRLAGLGSEPWGVVPVVNLVDPFPDPLAPGRLVTEGSIIAADRLEAWVVTTAEMPPEDPHRVLALLFASALPCADEVDVLVEGYGLHRADLVDPGPLLEGVALPAFDAAEGELRAAMAVSFVRHLLGREGEDGLLRLLAAPAGRLDETAKEVYGVPLVRLESNWRQDVAAGEPDVEAGQFLRMSLRYLRPYKARQAEIFAYMLLSLAFTASFPFVTRRLFDSAIPSGEFSQVAGLLGVLGVAFVVSLVAGLRQAYQTAWVSGAVGRDIRQAMYDRLQALPTSWYHHHPQGDVMSRLFSDVGQVQRGLSETIGQGVFQLVTLVVSAAIMLTINPLMGVIVLAGAPVVALVYRVMSSGARTRSIAVQEHSSELFSAAAENYRAAPVVKMFGLAGRERRRFGAQAERVFRSQRDLSLFGGLFGLSVNMIVTLLRLFILGFGAWLILEGRFTLGGLVAFLSIMGEVINPVTVLTGLGQEIQASMGSLIRVNEVLDADAEPDDPALPPVPPVTEGIRLVGVSFAYGPERKALDGIDVTIPAGQRVAFVGPSGSGKSTVLRLLMRMYDPDEGAILVDGVDLRHGALASWRDQIGVVFQDSFLFDTTLGENIALGRLGAGEAEVAAAAASAEVDAFADQLPRGYQTLVGEDGSNLSGGQRQRVAIARALIRDPRVLLLDEATSALDPRTERQINETIGRVARHRTVVAITHRLTSVVDYDRIHVIVEGRLVESGTHDELVARAGVYARLWAEQTGAEVPARPPFDVHGALSRVSLFAELDESGLARVAERLRPFTLDEGHEVGDGGGLLVVTSGRVEVVQHHVDGSVAPVTELGEGETFGVASVLGAPATSWLRARTHTELGFLDNEAIAALAAELPGVAARLERGAAVTPPATGRRLRPVTAGAPGGSDVRSVRPVRASGVHRLPEASLPSAGATGTPPSPDGG